MLTWIDLTFSATAADVDEAPFPGEPPAALAPRLASAKARAVEGLPPGSWVLAADTVVECAGESLGKPRDAAEARAMLARLRDAPHRVHTGVALREPASRREAVRCVTTHVRMRAYSEAEMEAYIATGDPFDKAGAYAIQHPGFDPVESVDRCYANVVGLPLCGVTALLDEWGCDLGIAMRAVCYQNLDYRCPMIDEGVRL
jgi:septum formation protein